MEHDMTDQSPDKPQTLEGKSPYELRINQGRRVPDPEVRAAIATGDLGFLHSFTTGSAVDGPGIRAVAWTTLCMFRCRYCHNPDTWTLSHGMPVTVGKAIEELRKYVTGLKVMKGGFTLSGGEPLMQARFAARLFAGAKQMGIHTAIETNGFYGDRLSDAELADIDLVILDMKAFNLEQHKRVTSEINNAPVLAFAERLAQAKHPMWLRYVLVPGLTDIPEEMECVAKFAASLGVVERAEILPFHQMGRYKWERLGLHYTLAETQPPSVEAVNRALDIFRSAGLTAY
jgi:pyruvate formate lyase activating enzyme